MRIGIVGSGNVGSALARGWIANAHQVMLGVRDTESSAARERAEHLGAALGSVREAGRFGQVVVLAVPWAAVDDVLAELGDIGDSILLDCTNPLAPGQGGLVTGGAASAGEHVAARAMGARVVKVFNSTGSGNIARPTYPEGAASMLLCGDDAAAKSIAAGLAADLGFDPVDAGALHAARLLEPLALLWLRLARGQGLGPDIGFRLMRR
jgi:hypothetical protein